MKKYLLAVVLLVMLVFGASQLRAQFYAPYYSPYWDAQYQQYLQYQNYLQWQNYLAYLQQYDPYYYLHVMHYQLYLQPYQPYVTYPPCCYLGGISLWSGPFGPQPSRGLSLRAPSQAVGSSRPLAAGPLPLAATPIPRATGRR